MQGKMLACMQDIMNQTEKRREEKRREEKRREEKRREERERREEKRREENPPLCPTCINPFHQGKYFVHDTGPLSHIRGRQNL